MSFNTGTPWCYGIDDTASCNCAIADDCQVDGIETVKRSTDYKDISLSLSGFSTGLGDPYVEYEGTRGVASASGKAILSSSGLSTTVNSNKIGLITTCSDTVASYMSCTNP